MAKPRYASHKGFAYNLCGKCLFNAYTLPTNIYSAKPVTWKNIKTFVELFHLRVCLIVLKWSGNSVSKTLISWLLQFLSLNFWKISSGIRVWIKLSLNSNFRATLIIQMVHIQKDTSKHFCNVLQWNSIFLNTFT